MRERRFLEKTGIISIDVKEDPKKEYKTCEVDLGAFYKEMREALQENSLAVEFKDKWGTSDSIKKGEFFEYSAELSEYKDTWGDLTRPPGVFEKRFLWQTSLDGPIEFETRWEGRCETKFSSYGWFEFALDIQARNVEIREVLVGNKKVKRHHATWEFRNSFVYKNKIIPDLLQNLKYIRSNPKLQQLYLDFAYYKTLENDMVYCAHDLFPLIYGVILKHFGSRQELKG